MKLEILGCKVNVYNWHSINLVPHGGAHDVCTDDRPFRILGRAYWATVFGVVVDVLVPGAREKPRAWAFLPVVGPFWSRRKKRWYWPPGDDNGDKIEVSS